MRVLMTAGFYDLSGTSIVIENLSDKLSEKGVHVTVGALSFKWVPTKKSYTVTAIPIGNVIKLKKSLDSFDILHNHHPITNYLSLVSRKPFIYHYYGAPDFGRGNLFRYSMLSSIKITNRFIDAVIEVSEVAGAELRQHFSLDKIRVVCNGVKRALSRVYAKLHFEIRGSFMRWLTYFAWIFLITAYKQWRGMCN